MLSSVMTEIVKPTIDGIIMDLLDQVLIGFLSLLAIALSTFFDKDKSTKGPFFNDLGILFFTSSSNN
jgi:hypothetical protein